MIMFLSGLFLGSFIMLFIMSLMTTAKRADKQSEQFFNKSVC